MFKCMYVYLRFSSQFSSATLLLLIIFDQRYNPDFFLMFSINIIHPMFAHMRVCNAEGVPHMEKRLEGVGFMSEGDI